MNKILVEKLINEFDFTLSESVIMDKYFQNILNKHAVTLSKYDYDSKMPSDDKIKSIKLTSNDGVFEVDEINPKGKINTISVNRIGTLLKKLFPKINIVEDKEIQYLINDLKMLSLNNVIDYDVQISKDLVYWYKKMTHHGIKSCVTDSGAPSKLLNAMQSCGDVSIVILINRATNKPCARALLWHNIKGLDAPFLDRTYPRENNIIHNAYVKWAKLNGYYYRESMSYDKERWISASYRNISYLFDGYSRKDMGILPYMDTFKYGWKSDKGYVVQNFEDNEKNIDYLTEPSGYDVVKRDEAYHDDGDYDDDYDGDGSYAKEPEVVGNCDICKKQMYDNEYTFRDKNNKIICRACYDKNYFKCYFCKKATLTKEMFVGQKPNYRQCCEKCWKERYFKCDNCEQSKILVNRSTKYENRDICIACAKDLAEKEKKYNLESIKVFNNEKMNTLLEQLFDSCGYTLNEAVDMAPEIKKILTKFGYNEEPNDEILKSIHPHPTEKGFLQLQKMEQGKLITQKSKKFGATLKLMYPNMDIDKDLTVRELIAELIALVTPKERYSFEVYDDISYWYKYLRNQQEHPISSCVTEDRRVISGVTDKLLKYMDSDKNIQIVVIKDTHKNYYIGRCLLWHNVIDLTDNKTNSYLDRTYPAGYEIQHDLYIKWADSKGYLHMDAMRHNEGDINGRERKMRFETGKTQDEIGVMPYMDSFYYYDNSNKDNTISFYNHTPTDRNDRGYYYIRNEMRTPTGTFLTQTVRCSGCNTYVPSNRKQDYVMHENRAYCTYCYNLRFFKCADCDKMLNSDRDPVYSVDGKKVCVDCYQKKYFKCHYCLNIYDRQNNKNITADGNDYCEKCYHSLFSTCKECNKEIKIRDAFGTGPTYYCEQCYHEKFKTCTICNNVFRLYQMKKFYKTLKSKNNSLDICDKCILTNAKKCTKCRVEYHISQFRDGSTVCNYCDNIAMEQCRHCMESFSIKDLIISKSDYKSQGEINGFCKPCFESVMDLFKQRYDEANFNRIFKNYDTIDNIKKMKI